MYLIIIEQNFICHRYFQMGSQVLESMKGYLEELVVELQQVGSVHILHQVLFFSYSSMIIGGRSGLSQSFLVLTKQLHCCRRSLILRNLFLKNPTNSLSEKPVETMKQMVIFNSNWLLLTTLNIIVSTKFVIQQYFFWVMKCEVVVIIEKVSGVFICWYFVQLRAQQDEERK